MKSFIFDTFFSDGAPVAVCGLCSDNSEKIAEELKKLKEIDFGRYKSGFTIDYRLEEILRKVLKPYKNDIICVGASVGIKDADCVTGGVLGGLSGKTLSSENTAAEENGIVIATRPGAMAFAAEKAGEDTIKAFFKAGDKESFTDFYNTLMDNGDEFILISDGSGNGAFGAVAVRGNIITLEETVCKEEQPEFFYGLKRIGIIGGTFDPVHNGHLIAAETVRQELHLDKIIFMPNGQTTYKRGETTEGEKRFRMTCLAVRSNSGFCVSSLEIDRKGTSYTVDTIEEIKKRCDSDAEIYFIMGADVLDDITCWKGFDRMANMCRFAAVTRPGYSGGAGADKMRSRGASVCFVEAPAMDISSSAIRNNVRKGKSVKYLMPEETEKFMRLHRLYTNKKETPDGIDSILKKLI